MNLGMAFGVSLGVGLATQSLDFRCKYERVEVWGRNEIFAVNSNHGTILRFDLHAQT